MVIPNSDNGGVAGMIDAMTDRLKRAESAVSNCPSDAGHAYFLDCVRLVRGQSWDAGAGRIVTDRICRNLLDGVGREICHARDTGKLTMGVRIAWNRALNSPTKEPFMESTPPAAIRVSQYVRKLTTIMSDLQKSDARLVDHLPDNNWINKTLFEDWPKIAYTLQAVTGEDPEIIDRWHAERVVDAADDFEGCGLLFLDQARLELITTISECVLAIDLKQWCLVEGLDKKISANADTTPFHEYAIHTLDIDPPDVARDWVIEDWPEVWKRRKAE